MRIRKFLTILIVLAALALSAATPIALKIPAVEAKHQARPTPAPPTVCALNNGDFDLNLNFWSIDIDNDSAQDNFDGYPSAPSRRNQVTEGELIIYQYTSLEAGHLVTVTASVRANNLYPDAPPAGGELHLIVFQSQYWQGTRVLDETFSPPNDNAWHTYSASFIAPENDTYAIAVLLYNPPAASGHSGDAQMDMRLDDATISCNP